MLGFCRPLGHVAAFILLGRALEEAWEKLVRCLILFLNALPGLSVDNQHPDNLKNS